jgi:hypothetical protein
MLRPLLSKFLSLLLAISPAGAQEFFPSHGFMLSGGGRAASTMIAATCQVDDTAATTYNQTLTFTGLDDAASVLVVVIALAEDTATTYNVTGITFDTVAGTEIQRVLCR